MWRDAGDLKHRLLSAKSPEVCSMDSSKLARKAGFLLRSATIGHNPNSGQPGVQNQTNCDQNHELSVQ